MKKLIYLLFLLPSLAIGQVINPTPDMVFKGQLGAGRGVATDPSAWFSIGPAAGSVRGVVFPQVSDTNAVVSPRRNGLFIWSLQKKRFMYWDSTSTRWRDISDVSGIDTLMLSTRAWRQKGIDSLALKLGGSITGSGTQYYVPRFGIGGTTLNTGTMYDSASRIGIGTTVPSTKLHVVTPEILGFSVQSQSTIASASAQLFNAFNATYLGVNGADGNSLITGSAPYNSFIGSGQNYGLDLGTNLTTRMTILPTGQVRVNNLAGTGTRMVVADTAGQLSTQTITSGLGGSGTLNYLSKWTPNGTTLGNSRIFDNGTNIGIGTNTFSFTTGSGIHLKTSGDANIKVSSGTKFGFDVVQAVSGNTFLYNRDNADIIMGTQNTERLRITGEEGQVRINSDTTLGSYRFQVAGNAIIRDGLNIRSLSGVDTRMIVADAQGNLSAQAIPSGGGGTGTVTSVSAGVGMSFPTITTSGAVNADTLVLATVSRVEKEIDSLAATISSGGGITNTGTVNYIPKITSSTSIGNSIAYDNNGEVLINTTDDAGDYKLQVNGEVYQTSGTTIAAPATRNASIALRGNGRTSDDEFFILQAGGSTDAWLWNKTYGGMLFGTNNSPSAYIAPTGVVKIHNLSGTGTRMVVSDSVGNLSTQAIPTSGGTAGVTSVSAGVGMNFPEITSTGAVSADTAVLATRGRLGKSIDSLAALIPPASSFPNVLYDTLEPLNGAQMMRVPGSSAPQSRVTYFTVNGSTMVNVNAVIYVPVSQWSQTGWNWIANIPPSIYEAYPAQAVYFPSSQTFYDGPAYQTTSGVSFSNATNFSGPPSAKIDQNGRVQVAGFVSSAAGPYLSAGGIDYVAVTISVSYGALFYN